LENTGIKKTTTSGVTKKMEIQRILNAEASDHELLFTNGEKNI